MHSVTTTLIVSLAFGILSAILAYRQGRDPYRWFVMGVILGIFGFVALAFISPPQKKAAPPAQPRPLPVILGPSDKFWYYLDPAHKQQGPMSLQALTSALRQGKISQTTYVWNEEMKDWKLLSELIQEG